MSKLLCCFCGSFSYLWTEPSELFPLLWFLEIHFLKMIFRHFSLFTFILFLPKLSMFQHSSFLFLFSPFSDYSVRALGTFSAFLQHTAIFFGAANLSFLPLSISLLLLSLNALNTDIVRVPGVRNNGYICLPRHSHSESSLNTREEALHSMQWQQAR